MKAYKVFNNDWTSNNKFQYEVGKSYGTDNIKLRERGFHACVELVNCFENYSLIQSSKYAEVELIGEILGLNNRLQCSEGIKIVKEFSFSEALMIIKKQVEASNLEFFGVYKSSGVYDSNGVDYSTVVVNGRGVFSSSGVNESEGVSGCNGISHCSGVDASTCVKDSLSVNGSSNVVSSEGVNYSENINHCCSVNGSVSCYNSEGISMSFGVYNSSGVSRSMFVLDCHNKYILFNKKVTEKRFLEVESKFLELCNGWIPTLTSFSNMPIEAFEYLKTLKEFDIKIFEEIEKRSKKT